MMTDKERFLWLWNLGLHGDTVYYILKGCQKGSDNEFKCKALHENIKTVAKHLVKGEILKILEDEQSKM